MRCDQRLLRSEGAKGGEDEGRNYSTSSSDRVSTGSSLDAIRGRQYDGAQGDSLPLALHFMNLVSERIKAGRGGDLQGTCHYCYGSWEA